MENLKTRSVQADRKNSLLRGAVKITVAGLNQTGQRTAAGDTLKGMDELKTRTVQSDSKEDASAKLPAAPSCAVEIAIISLDQFTDRRTAVGSYTTLK